MSNIEVATHYFQLSNQGDLAAIRDLFDQRATYSSSNVGLYYEVGNILEMMTSFFEQYQERVWTIDAVEEVKPHIVRVEFSFKGRLQSGEDQFRRGVEHLVIDGSKIRHIEVRPA
jgi:ketosteroid isomerase-like protein